MIFIHSENLQFKSYFSPIKVIWILHRISSRRNLENWKFEIQLKPSKKPLTEQINCWFIHLHFLLNLFLNKFYFHIKFKFTSSLPCCLFHRHLIFIISSILNFFFTSAAAAALFFLWFSLLKFTLWGQQISFNWDELSSFIFEWYTICGWMSGKFCKILYQISVYRAIQLPYFNYFNTLIISIKNHLICYTKKII